MNISRFFIDRPRFAGVLSILIFLVGLIALQRLPISEYPEVTPPQVVVRAQFPGANPRVIAETVSTPLEEQINGVENMLYMNSRASADGAMTLTVSFKIGTDPEVAATEVQNRVNRAAAPARRGAPDRRDHRRARRTSSWWCTWCRPTSATTRSTCATTRRSTCATSCCASPASAR